MFIFISAPCHAWRSLRRVIKMTSANCKCLQKCSLASLGQSAKMKGHICPSLFVCLFVYLLVVVAFLFSIPGEHTVFTQFWECFGEKGRYQASCGDFFPFFAAKVQILSALHSTTNLRFIWQSGCIIHFSWSVIQPEYSSDNFSLLPF